MSEFSKLVEEYLDEQSLNTHVAMLCRVVSFDPQQMKASVQPMQKGLPLIENVPAAIQKAGPFFIRVPYVKGDIVIVVFSDVGIDDQINTGAEAHGKGQRKHCLDDAIIVGGISPFNVSLPAEDGLIIAKKDLSAKVVIKENNDIVIETSGNLGINADSLALNADSFSLSTTSGSITATEGFDITKNTDTVPESAVFE